MAEYIEREALLKRIGEEYDLNYGEILTDPSDFADMVDFAPAADVAPVVHGRWEFDGSDFADIWKCSACSEDWYFEYDPRDAETLVKFCPNCGARMDGE